MPRGPFPICGEHQSDHRIDARMRWTLASGAPTGHSGRVDDQPTFDQINLVVRNMPAMLEFYRALGFEVFGTLSNERGGEPPNHRRWFLRRTIAPGDKAAD